MANPTLMSMPICRDAEKNTIPITDNGTTGKFSEQYGWQGINSLPLSAGGKAVERLDFNGVLALLGGIDYMTQRGYTFEYDNSLPYVVGCIVIDPLDGKTYRCINDVPAGATNPSQDTTNWVVYDIADYVGGALRITAYSVGDTSTLVGIPAGYFLECTTAGTTGAIAPVITSPVSAGQTISDGTVVWTVRKCFSTNGGILIGDVIARKGDNAALRIVGGTTGAVLDLNGINNTGANAFKGGARLYALDGDGLWGKLGLTPTGLFFRANGAKTDVDNYAYDLGGSAIVEKSLTPDGYIKRASGEILQWGSAPVTSGVATVTYPISFTSRNSCHCFAIPGSTSFQASVTYGGATASGCNIYVSNNSINSIHYIAVGY